MPFVKTWYGGMVPHMILTWVVWRAVCVKKNRMRGRGYFYPLELNISKTTSRCLLLSDAAWEQLLFLHSLPPIWWYVTGTTWYIHTITTPYGMVPTGLCNELHPHQYSTAQYANNSPEDPFESNQPKEVGRVSEKSPHLRRANYRRQAPFRDTRNCNL